MKIENLRKRALALLAASTMLLSMTGCSNSKSNYALKGTLLDNVIVVSVDGNLSFVRKQRPTVLIAKELEHNFYFDIITGESVTDYNNCCHDDVRKVENIEIIDSISNHLEPEELEKALNKTLTNEDIVNIITRIKKENENTLTLVP